MKRKAAILLAAAIVSSSFMPANAFAQDSIQDAMQAETVEGALLNESLASDKMEIATAIPEVQEAVENVEGILEDGIISDEEYSAFAEDDAEFSTQAVSNPFNSFSVKSFEMLYLANVVRIKNNRQPLGMGTKLYNAANKRAAEIKTSFSHTRPGGKELKTIFTEYSIPWSYMGENIARGYTSSLQVTQAWVNSSGHFTNMVNSNYTMMGTGFNSNYWVQLFAAHNTPSSATINSNVVYVIDRGSNEIIDDLAVPLQVKVGNETVYVPVMEEMCSGYNYNTRGKIQNVTVKYRGFTTTFKLYINPFSDVKSSDWFFSDTMFASMNSLMTGKSSTKFAPADNLLRAEFAVVIHRMSGKPSVPYKNKFPDVKNGQWYTQGIIWASNYGIVQGYSNGYFGVGDNITREQFVVMLHRYGKALGKNVSQRASLSGYPDNGKVSSFAGDAMKWAIAQGIITGDGGKLNPQGRASRAQCATMLTRFINKYS